jgi:aspartyl-tRNA(Asn)/glutamyl-tRNA(Gln) amidotransferase subunit B
MVSVNVSTFEPVIGLEVHAELLTRSKMFCGCAVVDATTAEPNTSVCEICTGMPGTLPVINRRAVEFALRVALALGCEISQTSIFARKNYFYPDLPKGYQISQYEHPLARNGCLMIRLEHIEKPIRIRRVHLEEDTGKLFHHEHHSLVDYNRSGVPLLEIVTEPDMSSVEEVKAFSTQLRSLLRYLEVNSGDMEKGVIRFEANVSVRPKGSESLYTRTEIKNLNSFRTLVRAVTFEVDRQSGLLSRGDAVKQETLGWDESTGETISQRSKEEAHDYRYFPEPDLPPLVIEDKWVQEIRSSLPELPAQKQTRYIETLGLSDYAAGVIAADRPVAEFFEAACAAEPALSPVKLANWISTDLFSIMNELSMDIDQSKLTPEAIAELVALVEHSEISAASGKVILSELFVRGGMPQPIIKELGLGIIQDVDQIHAFVVQTVQDHPTQVQEYLAGKGPIFQWLVGQVMRAAEGRADPSVVQEVLSKHLGSLSEEQSHPSTAVADSGEETT